MTKRIVDKLVRDNVVKHMEDQGKSVTYRSIESVAERKAKIVEKFWEKYKELFEKLLKNTDNATENVDDIESSLADMLEVLNTIAKLWWANMTTIAKKKAEKLAEKWWYEQWNYVEYIEDEENKK